MKRILSPIQVFAFLAFVLFGTACNGPVKDDSAKEKVAVDHPKLIKTIGTPDMAMLIAAFKTRPATFGLAPPKMGFTNTMGNRLRLIRNISRSLLQSPSGAMPKGRIWCPEYGFVVNETLFASIKFCRENIYLRPA